jgi:predicted Zn-dependent protease
VVARRALSWLAAGAALALIFVAVAVVKRARTHTSELPVSNAPTIQRTIAVFEVRDTTKPRSDSSHLIAHVKARIDASAGLRVVGATILPTVDVGQLSELLNARSSIELRSDERITDAAFRLGDSVIARRVYPKTLGMAIEDSILNAAAALEPWIRKSAPDDTLSGTDNADVRSRRADSLFHHGATLEALREARRAHELDPLSAPIHLAYARLLERSGRDADAARERHEQQRIATILHPTPKDQLARARFKHVPKRPPRTSQPQRQPRRSGSNQRP